MIIGTTLIVLTWVLFMGMGLPLWAGIVITVVSACWILFWVLFGVYFFNLDMKATSLLYPLFNKHYDHIKRNRQI